MNNFQTVRYCKLYVRKYHTVRVKAKKTSVYLQINNIITESWPLSWANCAVKLKL